jgi:hypothetical protein
MNVARGVCRGHVRRTRHAERRRTSWRAARISMLRPFNRRRSIHLTRAESCALAANIRPGHKRPPDPYDADAPSTRSTNGV